MDNYVDFFTGNHVINCAFIAWFIAQVLKVVLNYFSTKKVDLTRFVGAGGMPSSHSACMFGLTTAVAQICSVYSVEFAMALTMSGVVMYDATGVRRAAGEQAKILNYMMENWNQKRTPQEFQNELKELLGHTPVEVIAGAFLGFAVAYVLGVLTL